MREKSPMTVTDAEWGSKLIVEMRRKQIYMRGVHDVEYLFGYRAMKRPLA